MAKEYTILIEGGGDDDDDENRDTPEPQSPTPEPETPQPEPPQAEVPPPPNVPPPQVTGPPPPNKPFSQFKKSRAQKEQERRQREFDRALAAQFAQEKRERAAAAREQERLLRREDQAARRADAERIRQAQRESSNTINEIRTDAVTKRVQAYSGASLLGIPGYVGASILDQFLFRPQEQKAVGAEQEYQEKLRQYKQLLQDVKWRNLERQRQAVRNQPIEATLADDLRKQQGIPVADAAPDFVGPPRPPEPPNPTLEPEPLPPERPKQQAPEGFFGSPAANTAITALLAARMANEAIGGGIRAGFEIQKGLTSQSPLEGTKRVLSGARTLADPLGVNIPMTVAVEGMTGLISVTENILKQIEADKGFAPETLAASVEGSIAKLAQQIEIAQRLDPATAELVRLNTQMELAWNELKATFIQEFLPEIRATMKVLIAWIEFMRQNAETTHSAFEIASGVLSFDMKRIIQGLYDLIGVTKDNADKDKHPLDSTNILSQIDSFMNPATYTKR